LLSALFLSLLIREHLKWINLGKSFPYEELELLAEVSTEFPQS